MRNPVRCDGDLRLMTNRSFVSIELRASGIARGDLIAEWQLVFADRSGEFIRDELIASIARFAMEKAREMENRWTDCLCNDLHAKSH